MTTRTPDSTPTASRTLAGRTAVVTGASGGFGLGVAAALVAAGATVVGVARHPDPLDAARDRLGDALVPVVGDAASGDLAGRVLQEHRPTLLVLNAGAVPVMGAIHDLTWDEFSRNWDVDVQHVFEWTRAALRYPLPPGSAVASMSSGAALRGSPLSGGYAGAKAAVRFITSYAADEARRASLGIRFLTLLPQLSPATRLGQEGVAKYAERDGVDAQAYAARLGTALTPERLGAETLALLLTEPDDAAEEYLITGSATQRLPT